MNILQIGVPKCGNFWIYQIIQRILQMSGAEVKNFIQNHPIYPLAKSWDLNFPDQASINVLDITDHQCSYRISSIFRMPVEDMEVYARSSSHIWTHSPVCKVSGHIFELFDKKVYVIRDPRDRAISAAGYYCSEYMMKYYPQKEKDPVRYLEKNFDVLMREWVWHVWDHLRLSKEYDIHIMFYENLLNDFQSELAGLLNYLKIDLSESDRNTLESASSFSNLKKQNPKHLSKGTSGYWVDTLTKDQIEKSELIAGPLIRYLKYTGDRNEPLSFNYTDGEDVFENLKDEIINSPLKILQY